MLLVFAGIAGVVTFGGLWGVGSAIRRRHPDTRLPSSVEV
jgi:hypothetical protein